jgi:hypothetical protein
MPSAKDEVVERTKEIGDPDNYRVRPEARARRVTKQGRVTYEADVRLPSTMVAQPEEAKELAMNTLKAAELAWEMMDELKKEAGG